MRKRRSIVWFKSDLRLHDNPALDAAVRGSDSVIPVYCVDERLFETTALGFKKMGKFRARFLLESLKDLDQQLRSVGSGLMVLWGKPELVIPEMVKHWHADAVFVKKEVAPEELFIHREVEKSIFTLKCTMEVFSTSTLYLATDLPFPVKAIPDVFTDFRKRTERESTVRDVVQTPSVINSPEIPSLDWSDWPHNNIEQDERSAFPFSGGESHALKRLRYYLEESHLISNYKETRNGLIGTDYSSKFSPWLAVGSLSPVTVYHAIKNYEREHGANDSTYWMIFELLWRDYFRFMMKKHGRLLFLKNGLGKNGVNTNRHNPEKFKAWRNGNTGVDFIDANMIELNRTGFMSNRGRQNVASYLCHDLKCDWRYGAAYFEEMLIDYDACSNWGNWAYIAGVGNDPRKDRYFNQEKQSELYDKDGSYRKLWLTS